MNRILVNGTAYPCPLKFAMSKVDNIVSEIKTMSGNTVADRNGYKYADATLKWEWIENSQLQSLLSATGNGEFNFTFKDVATGAEKTIKAVRKSAKCTESASVDHNGNLVWLGIEIALSFPTCYHD